MSASDRLLGVWGRFTADLKGPLGRREGPPLGQVALSVAAILTLTFVFPLIMGGTIAAAVALEGEVLSRERPAASGMATTWWFADACGAPTGGSGLGTPSVVISAVNGINFTLTNSVGSGVDLYCVGSGGIPSNYPGPYIIQLDDEAFNVSGFGDPSRLAYQMTSASYCSSVASCDDGWRLDFAVKVNGSLILTRSSVASPSCAPDALTPSAYVGSRCYMWVEVNTTLSGIESATLKDRLGACLPSCNVTVHLDDIQQVCDASTCYHSMPFGSNHKHRLLTYTTEADTAGFLLQASPYILSIITLALVVGSTPLWDPFRRWVG